jgi:enoyl-CoA hydratase/carnithine racemase
MEMLQYECIDRIAVIRLNNGTTNAINLGLISALSNKLRGIQDDLNVQCVVLTSSNDKFFSIGFDIPLLYYLSKDKFKEFYLAFNQLCLDLYTCTKPTIAAITGHAVAGGCIIALCCDYRYIAEGHKLMGLNEIKLGLPIPYPGDCILRDLVGTRVAREMAETGSFYEPEKLLQIGMVDKVLPLENVLAESFKKMKTLASYSKRAVDMVKRNRVLRIKNEILEHLKEKERFFIECWHLDETRTLLKEAMEKF